MILRFLFLAFALGRWQGYAEGRASAADFLRRQANLYRGQPHDSYRRGAINFAADRFIHNLEVGRQ